MNWLSQTVFGGIALYNILIFLAIVGFFVGLAQVFRVYMRRILKDKVAPDSLNSLQKWVSFTVVAIGVATGIPQLGVNLTGLLSAGGEITVGNALVFIVVVLSSVGIARILKTYLRRMLKDKVAVDLLNVLEKVIYYSVIVIGIIAVLPQVGIDLTGLLVAGGFAGLVIGFASQSVVSNLISGLFLIFERPVKIGDQINVENVSGYIDDIRVLSTIVRTYDGVYVRIPNEKVFSSNIANYVVNAARRFEYNVDISYSDDAETAINIIKAVLERHPFILKNPLPNVFVESLGESGVTIVVRVWTPSEVWYPVKAELLWKIKVELERAGITIPFPQRVIHLPEKENHGDTVKGVDARGKEKI